MRTLKHWDTGLSQDVNLVKDNNPTHEYSKEYKTHYIVKTYRGGILGYISKGYIEGLSHGYKQSTKEKNECVFAYTNGKGHTSYKSNIIDCLKMGVRDAIYYI